MSSLNELKNELFRLEERFLLPEVRASSQKLGMLLAEDFVEYGSSGRIFDKESIIVSLTTTTQSIRSSIEDFSVKRLSDDTVLVTYRILNWSKSGEKIRESLRSSIWVFRQYHWRMLFHQGTRR